MTTVDAAYVQRTTQNVARLCESREFEAAVRLVEQTLEHGMTANAPKAALLREGIFAAQAMNAPETVKRFALLLGAGNPELAGIETFVVPRPIDLICSNTYG